MLGPEEFIRRTIDAGVISAKKLLTAFAVRPPDCFEGQEDQAYRSLLVLAISRELAKRAKLPQYNTVDDAVELLKKSQNIIVLTGAGISTSLGIPDFRSAGTGLYSKLAYLGLNDPQEVFNIEVFKEDPTIFFSVAKDILPETKRFTPTHAFIALLQNKGKLLTNYSQNIDNIEAHAGISRDKLVQWYVQSCHFPLARIPSFVSVWFRASHDFAREHFDDSSPIKFHLIETKRHLMNFLPTATAPLPLRLASNATTKSQARPSFPISRPVACLTVPSAPSPAAAPRIAASGNSSATAPPRSPDVAPVTMTAPATPSTTCQARAAS